MVEKDSWFLSLQASSVDYVQGHCPLRVIGCVHVQGANKEPQVTLSPTSS